MHAIYNLTLEGKIYFVIFFATEIHIIDGNNKNPTWISF